MEMRAPAPAGGNRVLLQVRHRPDDARLSARALQVRRMFGLREGVEPLRLDPVRLPTTGITLVTGPSGAGKSSLLRELCRATGVPAASDLPPPGDGDRVVDLIDAEVHTAIAWLSRFGLAEPRVLTTRPEHLSAGQAHRLALARILREGRLPVVVDEFCSDLDRDAARVIAHTFQRTCRALGLSAVVATAHDDLDEFLCPDRRVQVGLDGSVHLEAGRFSPGQAVAEWIRGAFSAGPGTKADYDKLARFHYRWEHERGLQWGDIVRSVVVVRYRDVPVAVRVFSRPFPRAFESLTTIQEINERVLLSERTVVHPSYRGLALTPLLWPDNSDGVVALSQSALARDFPYLKSGAEHVPHPSQEPVEEQLRLRALLESLDPDTDPNSIDAVQELLQSLPASSVDEVRQVASRAAEVTIRRQVEFFAEHSGVAIRPPDLNLLVRVTVESFHHAGDGDLAALIEMATPFPMAAFRTDRQPDRTWARTAATRRAAGRADRTSG